MKKLLFLLLLLPFLGSAQVVVYGLTIKKVGDSTVNQPVSITPPPPTITGNDSTNVLSAYSPYGISEIVYAIGNGNYGQYTGPITVGPGYVPSGTYLFKVKAGTNRYESAASTNPIFTADVVAVQQTLQSFTLINATANTDIQTIVSNSTINLATLSTKNLNIRGNTSPPTVGSVAFNLSGAQTVNHTETGAPYSLFGDNNGVYNSWTPAVGNYVLTATPYRDATGTGTSGTPLTIYFRVIDSALTVSNTTPSAPIVAGNDTADTLSASSNLGASEILVSENNGAYTSYAGTINVGDVNRAAGYWLFKIRSATGRNESPVTASPAFTAKAIPPTSTSNIVTLRATYTTTPTSPTATFTALGNNKRVGFILTKDDGNVGDYNIIYPLINGGTSPTNGHVYPGMTYSDDAGGVRNWGYTFAINGRGNTLKDGSNTTVTSWAQYKDLLRNNNFALANHSADHSNTPTALYQLQLNDTIINRQLGFRMRSIVLPAGLGGFVQGGITMGWPNIWSSEGYGGPGNPSADGYDAEVSWGETFDANSLASSPTRHMIGTRMNFDGLYNDANRGFRNWVDGKFAQSISSNSKQVYTAFSHGPEAGWEADSLYSMLKYIQNHPSNKGDVWYPNLQQFGEYMETKRLAIKSAPSINNTYVTYTIDLSNLNPLARYKDMSLLLSTGGTLTNVEVAGADSYDFNVTTGLVNIYKGGQIKSGGITSPTTLPDVGTGTIPPPAGGGGTTNPDTVAMKYGEIPWEAYRGVTMDYNPQTYYQLKDGKFDNVDLTANGLLTRPKMYIPFDTAMHVIVDKVLFGDGQHNHNAGDPMHSWILDTISFKEIPGPDFYGNNSYVFDTMKLATPIRTDYFVMERYYPIPTELKFYGWYRPTPTPKYTVPAIPIDKHLGAVTYLWDMLQCCGNGVDNNKLGLAKGLDIFRLYDDFGSMTKASDTGPTGNGLAIFNPQNGAWRADDMLDSLHRNNKDVLFCIKGMEGMPQYVEMCRQVAIRYGNNSTISDTAVHIYLGPGYPANTIKKGLGLIKYIQLGNEPNRWWRWNNGTPLFDPVLNVEGMMTPFQLAAQWKLCYDAIKKIDPTIIVLTPGLATNNPAYFEGAELWSRMYNQGKPIFDGVCYHEYNNTESGQNQTGGTTPGVAPEPAKMFERAQAMKQAAFEIGGRGKNTPVYITESGYSISMVNATQAPPSAGIGSKDIYHVAGDWTVRSSLAMNRVGLDGLMFYQMYDDGNFTGAKFQTFMNWDLSCGLSAEDPNTHVLTRRPAWYYLEQTGTVLSGYNIQSWSMTTDSIYIDKFVKPGSPTIWSLVRGTAKGATGNYTLPLTNVHQVEINTLNDSQLLPTKTTANINGSYIVNVTETPIYIKELN